jgi:diadenosine tetraphosphate (Ap4A) HIT family hydrolase
VSAPGCALCREQLETPVLLESQLWRIALNENQNLLGKTIIVLRRHLEDAARLTPAEWAELRQHIWIVQSSLRRAFTPDHFNLAFLGNHDRHVHLHVIPRYAAPRELGGERFVDPEYPAHYAVPAPERRVGAVLLERIRQAVDPPGP